MELSVQDHLTFWRALHRGVSAQRKSVVKSLKETLAKVAGTPFEAITQSLIVSILGGDTLSQAMEPHETIFSRSVRTMVQAGEAGSVLDVIMGRIIEGLQDGSFAVPGAEPPPETEHARYWRAFGWLLSSGVPCVRVLEILIEEIAGAELTEATQAIRQAILDGARLGEAMQAFPEVFDKEILAAVELGEEKGILDEQAFHISDALTAGDLSSLVGDDESGAGEPDSQDSSTVIRLVNQVLMEALNRRASDIHFDPTEDGRGRIRLRVDGVLQNTDPAPAGMFPKMVCRLKVMACLDIAERRLPQDGRITVNVKGNPYDLRVATVPAMHGERLVVRILDRSRVCLDLDRMGFLDDDAEKVRKLTQLPNGVVIVTGPTGSGRTTLLYAMVNQIDRDRSCVMSVEDPVAVPLEGVAQVQVKNQIGLGTARALRAVLRQDPDVIMIGETRDLETLEITVQLALTGHLVLSVFHAGSAAAAIRRLIDVGLEPYRINACLSGAIAVRLVRTLCQECKEKVEPALHSVPPETVAQIRELGEGVFCGPKGCDACKGTGYRGRTTIYEILAPDRGLRDVIASSPEIAALHESAIKSGMRPLFLCGIEKAVRGITSVEEVCRVAGPRLEE